MVKLTRGYFMNKTTKFTVKGMSCAACVNHVEKAALSVSGVEKAEVSLLTNSMIVWGSFDENDLIEAVHKAGYKVSPVKPANTTIKEADAETKKRLKTLILSIPFLLLLLYCSVGADVFHWPLPFGIYQNHLVWGLVQAVLATVILVLERRFFISGFKSLFRFAPNMDALVALGSSVSYIYSLALLIQCSIGQTPDAHCFYFDSSAMILVLISVGKLLEAYSKGKTTSALDSLKKLQPPTAHLITSKGEIIVPLENIQVGDKIALYTGQTVPCDCVILNGNISLNEALLTGESLPVEKKAGDEVSTATIIENGFAQGKVIRTGMDTALARIIAMVERSATGKAPAQRIADKVAGIFVPVVMGIALITFAVWMLIGAGFEEAVTHAVSVLVISCPCSLGLATPVAIMVGNGIGAKHGILFKNAETLENLGKCKTVAFDKTGTLTLGKPTIQDIIITDQAKKLGISTEDLMRLAYSIEAKSTHPLSQAVCDYAQKLGLKPVEVMSLKNVSGKGIMAEALSLLKRDSQKPVFCSTKIGKWDFALNNSQNSEEDLKFASDDPTLKMYRAIKKGQTLLYITQEEKGDYFLLGALSVSDTVKPDAHQAVESLKNLDVRSIMLSGDTSFSATGTASQCGMTSHDVFANLLPQDKQQRIRELKSLGPIAMVGDGINDAPSLTEANIGIAIGAGTDVAIDAADVVLLKNNTTDVPRAIYLSRKTLINIKENLFWAFFYNILGIPLAAGAFSGIGLTITPIFCALAMSLSSTFVVLNALRLNLIQLDKALITDIKQEDAKMTKTITVTGMMCEHCEAHVEKALLKIEGITKVKADHTTNSVQFDCDHPIDTNLLRVAVSEAGYEMKI